MHQRDKNDLKWDKFIWWVFSVFSLTQVLPYIMGQEGLMMYSGARHQGAIEMIWLHFWNLSPSFVFLYMLVWLTQTMTTLFQKIWQHAAPMDQDAVKWYHSCSPPFACAAVSKWSWLEGILFHKIAFFFLSLALLTSPNLHGRTSDTRGTNKGPVRWI